MARHLRIVRFEVIQMHLALSTTVAIPAQPSHDSFVRGDLLREIEQCGFIKSLFKGGLAAEIRFGHDFELRRPLRHANIDAGGHMHRGSAAYFDSTALMDFAAKSVIRILLQN
ncbi:MAG TPA: hypothetical protein VFQ89_05420 [Candidatus Binatia bacterium]|nr:hypothetical protein [Candidatus Binatia bacterium]